MANTISYPKATAKSDDLILGTSMPLPNTNEDPRTVNFSIGQINGLANSPDIATAAITVTNAQLATLPTVPVEILPAVTNYSYQILGVLTQAQNYGSITSSYDWSSSGDGVLFGQNILPTQHKVEIPNSSLPDGGVLPGEPYIATPIAGTWRSGASVRLSTTQPFNPTALNGPNSQLNIYITYRIIQTTT
ncbi:MAG: hypothetical protein GY787_23580 [Alteromonadales bacterium]|nr:hypothetical protein [Alteromonadales bacterium]